MKINNMAVKYKVIGIMSGTSLDGVDLAYIEFSKTGNTWSFDLKYSETIKYDHKWKKKLMNLMQSNAEEFAIADVELGHYFGLLTNRFVKKCRVKPDFISSHGHTVFHQPERKTTVQIGNGATIAAVSGLITLCNFRVTDVAKGGQGAPLVPIGDRLLFGDFEYCLNLGGIANISFEKNKNRIAFDICPVNMAFNYIAEKAGKRFDNKGVMASKGNINKGLLQMLNNLAFYKKSYPKSLGAEWFNTNFKPLLDENEIGLADIQATLAEHISFQIGRCLVKTGSSLKDKMLVTGGGAFHEFLIAKMKLSLPVTLVLPDKHTINFKEALIFGFLGVLRFRNEINTLSSVTGAKSDSSSGAVFNP